MSVQVLGPFRQEDRLAALRTEIQGSAVDVFSRARRSEFHDVSSVMLLPLSLWAIVAKSLDNKAVTLSLTGERSRLSKHESNTHRAPPPGIATAGSAIGAAGTSGLSMFSLRSL